MYQRIRDFIYRRMVRLFLRSRRLQSYLHSLLMREDAILLKKVVAEYKEGEALQCLLRQDDYRPVREEIDRTGGAALDRILVKENSEHLNRWALREGGAGVKLLLHTLPGRRLAEFFEADETGILPRILEADGFRMLKRVLGKDRSRLLVSLLTADGNLLVRSDDFHLLEEILKKEADDNFWSLLADRVAGHYRSLIQEGRVVEAHRTWRSGARLEMLHLLLDSHDGQLLHEILSEENWQRLEDVLARDPSVFDQEMTSGNRLLAALKALAARSDFIDLLIRTEDVAFIARLFEECEENPFFRYWNENPEALDKFLLDTRMRNLFLAWVRHKPEGFLTYLLEMDRASLDRVLSVDEGNWVGRLVDAHGYRLLQEVLSENSFERLRDVLSQMSPGKVHQLLTSNHSEVLRRVLEDDDSAILRNALDRGGAIRLRQVLEADDFHLLREYLNATGFECLKVFLDENDQGLLSRFLSEDGCARLHEVLKKEDYGLLRIVLWAEDCAALKAVVDRDEQAALERLLRDDRFRRLKGVLFEKSRGLLRDLIGESPEEFFASVFDSGAKDSLSDYLLAHQEEVLFPLFEDRNLALIRTFFTAMEGRGARRFLEKEDHHPLAKLLAADGYRALQAVLRKNHSELLGKLLRDEEGFLALIEALEADHGTLNKRIMDHEDQRLLKVLLQADRQERLFKILETENFWYLNRGLEADQQRLLKGALRKDDHRLLKLVLTSAGNEIFRELASSDEGRFFARLLESDNLQILKKALSADNLRLLRKVLKIDGFSLLEKMLAEDEALLLRSFFADDRGELFEKTFVADNLHLLKLKLREKDCELLKEVLLADKAALLHRLLEENDAAILKEILFEEDSHLLKSILAGQDYRLLESALMADGYRLLKRILHRHQAKALVAALSADGFALLEKSMDAEGGRLLVEALRLDTFRRFFRVIEQDNYALFKVLFQHREFLYPLRLLTELEPRLLKSFLSAANYRLPRELIVLEEGAVLRGVLLADQKALLKRFLVDQGFIREILADKRLSAVVQFLTEWREVKAIVDSQREGVGERVDRTTREITTTVNLHRQIGSVFCEEDTAYLAEGELTFPEFPAFWVLLHEILLNEDYFFQTKTESPRILDCGTHFGLSLYYFKTLFPKSRITAFEPVPGLRELATSNMTRNGFQDVEILPYALADKRGTARFQISKVDTMAGSLTSRNEASGAEFEEIEVECRPLSEFLQEPVNFLKLDIEGVEDLVLEEAKDHLHRVEHIFVEYHQDKTLTGDRLPRILEILDQAGFDTHLDKSYSAHQTTGRRPLTAVGKSLSLSIWGRNRNWKEMAKEAASAPAPKASSPAKATKPRGKRPASGSTAPKPKTPSKRK